MLRISRHCEWRHALSGATRSAGSEDEAGATKQSHSKLNTFYVCRKFKDVLKTIEYVKGTVVSEPVPEA
jgi:hypothetical protein